MPTAISVTRRHLPNMEHIGDITLLDGGKLPPVDIISFGSPCQGLSAAGKRRGLADPRSALFSEAIRIINEMRDSTNGYYPTWAIWENVPGALSSGTPRGSDFRAVLEAFTESPVPFPRSGKWTNAGMVRGGRANVAWCVYNSQYFGTAQRRRRIFLVADFRGKRAAQVLFIPKSLQGYFEAGGTPRQGAAAYAPRGIDSADRAAHADDLAATIFAGYGNHWNGNAGAYDGGNFALSNNFPFQNTTKSEVIILNDQGGESFNVESGEQSPTLRSQTHGNLPIVAKPADCLTPWDVQSRRIHDNNGVWPALYSGEGGGHGYVAEDAADSGHNPNCLNPWDTQQLRVFTDDGASPTLAGADGGGGRNPGGLVCQNVETNRNDEEARPVAAFLGGAGKAARSVGYSEKVSPTLKAGASGFIAPCLCQPKPLESPDIDKNGESYSTDNHVCAAFMGDSSASSYGIEYSEEAAPTLKPRLSGIPCLCEPNLARTLTARGDSSPCADRGQNIVAIAAQQDKPNILCAATGQPNAEILDNLSATLTCYHEQPIICEAVGVHQNQIGDINTSEKAYTLNTNGNATGRNSPLVCTNIHAFSLDSAESNSMKSSNPHSGCREVETARTIDTTSPCPAKNQGGIAVVEAHPKICGTLCASGAGLSRTAGLASETDLCVVQKAPDYEPIPIQDKATRYSGGGDTRNDDGAGNGLGVGKGGDPAPTITAGDRHAVAAYCLQGNMIGRQDSNGPLGSGITENKSCTLTATDIAAVAAVDCRNFKEVGDMSGTLQAKNTPGYSLNYQNPVRTGYIVRRLTPKECERLQGYPDGWTEFGQDCKPISDTARYMMLGNSVAVPCVAYIMKGIVEQYSDIAA